MVVQTEETGIPGGRNRMSTAMARRGKMATVVLTGNPGSPGVPSGPCDITETKQVVKEQHFHRQQECCNFGPTPSQHLPKA